MSETKRVLAVGAHPDDVEFGMAGTLILLRDAGYEPHIMTMANGSCGTAEYDEPTIIAMRRKEAEAAAAVIGATYHPGLVRDLEVYYTTELVRRACAVVREINPTILLIPNLRDYMEDHMITARIMVTAAFCKGMRNYYSIPHRDPVCGDTFVYHAMPHGLRDGMNVRHQPETYVRIDDVIDLKEKMLVCHKSQKNWLDVSQGMGAYQQAMRDMNAELAGWSKQRWQYAEGFQRHCHIGFSAEEKDPLREVLRKHVYANPTYARDVLGVEE